MAKIDTDTIMMDAGVALFTSRGSFGTVMGQTRAELAEYGNVLGHEDVPQWKEDFDLMLDFSSALRKRYITCKVEDAGDTGTVSEQGEPLRRYAVTLKEGDGSTPLRGICHIIGMILPFVLSAVCGGGILLYILSAVIAILLVFSWISPDKKAVEVCRRIKEDLEKGIQTNLPR